MTFVKGKSTIYRICKQSNLTKHYSGFTVVLTKSKVTSKIFLYFRVNTFPIVYDPEKQGHFTKLERPTANDTDTDQLTDEGMPVHEYLRYT